MPKLAANLSWIYQEVPFLQRFGAAAANGFKAVEILFPYEAPAGDIAAELKRHKLTQALFNLPPGDWSKGERGLAALPGREREFAAALDTALEYAKGHRAVLLANHGPVVAGTSLSAASASIEELEETAKLHLLLQGLKTRTLSDFQVREIEEAFPS